MGIIEEGAMYNYVYSECEKRCPRYKSRSFLFVSLWTRYLDTDGFI